MIYETSPAPHSPFSPGQHLQFTAHAPPPFCALRGQTFTVAGVWRGETDRSKLTLIAPPLPEPSTIQVPQDAWCWLEASPEWPVLVAAYPATFRLVVCRSTGEDAPDARLKVGRWRGQTFGHVFRADVFGGELYPHSKHDDLEIEAALRGLLRDESRGWMVRENVCGIMEHDAPSCDASVPVLLSPELPQPFVTATGHGSSVTHALARALRMTLELRAAFAASRQAATTRPADPRRHDP